MAADQASLPEGRLAALCPNADAQAGLAAIGRAIEAATATGCAALRDAEARCALRAAILDTARRLLAPPEASGGPQSRGSRSRQRIVHAADAYLRAHPARPIYSEELCAALGVSTTSLYQAFRATFSMSPHRYLKLRRMGMVRAALHARGGPWRSVKAIALSHGFWHLGQFARDYKALYGETPSATLSRTRIAGRDVGAPGAASDAAACSAA
jgi:AraC family ethanolamine operon transcriptional activator